MSHERKLAEAAAEAARDRLAAANQAASEAATNLQAAQQQVGKMFDELAAAVAAYHAAIDDEFMPKAATPVPATGDPIVEVVPAVPAAVAGA